MGKPFRHLFLKLPVGAIVEILELRLIGFVNRSFVFGRRKLYGFFCKFFIEIRHVLHMALKGKTRIFLGARVEKVKTYNRRHKFWANLLLQQIVPLTVDVLKTNEEDRR